MNMKNKIPIWDNYERYLPALHGGVLSGLLVASDRAYQMRKWLKDEGPEVDWRDEASVAFDGHICYWFKNALRRGDLNLNCEQIKAILRVHVMWNHFDDLMVKDANLPKEYVNAEQYMINHPYWEKVCRQAQYALSLIEIDKADQS